MVKKLMLLTLIIGLVLISSVVTAQSEVTVFPELTGMYEVGRTSFDMIDDSREEILTSDEGDIREFTITVFYPAIPVEDAEPAPYAEEALRTPLAREMDVPTSFITSFQPHAYADAPIMDGEFPVILFSHGLGAALILYTGQLEDLASHGYIVVGISHSYTTPAVVLSDGRVLRISQADASPLQGVMENEAFELALADVLAPLWVEDMLFVLNQLEALNTGDTVLAGHMDVSRIGAFGHSFGGATSLESAYQDERILGAIDMDGSIYGEVVEQGLTIPAMVMRSDSGAITDEELQAAGMTRDEFETMETEFNAEIEAVLTNATPGYVFMLPDSAHNTYATDLLVIAGEFPSIIPAQVVGTVGAEYARTTIHETVLAFFNTYVAGDGTPQFADLSLEGVELTIFNGE